MSGPASGNGPVSLDDARWQEVLEATNGDAWPCYQCGTCTAVCPWGRVREEPLNVRKIIRAAQLGVEEDGGMLWLCTSCGACETRCPRGVPIVRVLRALRSLAWKKRQVPKGLPSVLWGLYQDGNPYRLPPSARSDWAKSLEVRRFQAGDEMLLYLGCTASYDRRMQKIARALVRLLREAGVSFGTLGDDEPCCGEAAMALGHAAYAAEIAEANARLFAAKKVRALVAISPHCYDMFLNHTPRLEAGFKTLHYTQVLAELLKAGRLSFKGSVPKRVAFHDPCYLGRRNGEYEAPREVLRHIPGVDLTELAECRENALCCGAGGGRMFLETPAAERFSRLRVRQAGEAGAQILAAACPFCISCLEDSANQIEAGPTVMDVAELALEALGAPAPAPGTAVQGGRQGG